MPYPYLPDDFDTAYESTSLTYPNANFDPSLGAALYARYLDELEYADQLGFDGIAVNEHHQSGGRVAVPQGAEADLADGDTARVHVPRVAARRACLRDEAARQHLLRGPARPGTGGRRVA